MSYLSQIRDSINHLTELIGPALLDQVGYQTLELTYLDSDLRVMNQEAGPSFLPFCMDNHDMLAFHLWPGRPLERSPIVSIHDDAHEISYLCDGLSSMPIGLWLHSAPYYKREPNRLRRTLDEMASRLPNGRKVPEKLWGLLERTPDLETHFWRPTDPEQAQLAWRWAEVGHPFAGMPAPPSRSKAEEVLPQLEAFVRERREPELLALLLTTRLKAGQPVGAEDILFVLQAEAWRRTDPLGSGWWTYNGSGLCPWDALLRNLPDPHTLLQGTPFEPLADHPETYSGNDPEGHLPLLLVAENFRELGDHEGYLRQLRNAARVAIFAREDYPDELVLTIADACDLIEPGSLAALLARAMKEIDRGAI